MIVVTGGAGCIGSALVWRLNRRGEKDILIVDHLNHTEKWKNLVGLEFSDYLDRDRFIHALEAGDFGNRISHILHMGACSSTTESDSAYLMENNYRYTMRLALWRERHAATRLIYASSAATYGDGSVGYSDDLLKLPLLRPLNMYGYSKHLFDLQALRRGWFSSIVGLKYFNVFGPNENHKGDMRSVICKAFPRMRDEGRIGLFASGNPAFADGGQARDFIYVKDAADMTLFFLDHPEINGLYNIGSGKARTWNDAAAAMFVAFNKKPVIEYIPLPEHLRGKYQYFTQADLANLHKTGCRYECMDLKEAIRDYVQNYLVPDARLAS